MNPGQSADAEIAAHAHLYVLPRSTGDTSFITNTGGTRVVPEALETTWEKLSKAFRAGQIALRVVTRLRGLGQFPIGHNASNRSGVTGSNAAPTA